MQPIHRLNRIADQALAERESGVLDPDDTAHDYLEGVQDALRWATGLGGSPDLDALIARADQADRDDLPSSLEELAVELEEGGQVANPAGLAARLRDIAKTAQA